MKRVKASSVILAGLLASVMSAMPAFGQEAGGMEEAQDVAASQEVVNFDESWQWASSSEIHTGSAVLYRAGGSLEAPGRKNFTVCVNAGHGTAGGEGVQTLSHPDGTPKVTGGTNAEGAVYSTAISSGMAFLDGTPEASANLMTALALKDGATEEQIEQLVKYQESLEQYCYPGTLFVKMELIYPDTISDQEAVDVSYGKGTVISYFHNLKKGGGTGRDTYAEKTHAAFYEFLSTHYTKISAPAVLLQLDDTYTACFQDSQGSVLGYSFGASGSRGSFLDIVVVRHDYFE